MAVSSPARSRAAVLPFPGTGPLRSVGVRRLLPPGRALLVGFALLAAAVLAYLGARETSVFAVRSIVISGATPRVATHVRAALRPFVGKSLLAVHGADLRSRLARLPDVAGVTYDRDFPHTLRLVVTPAHSIAVLRRGSAAWIVSSAGRVIRSADLRAAPRLPRIWVPRSADVEVGNVLSDGDATRALRALAAARAAGFAEQVATVRAADELSFVLASGLRIRFGDASSLPAKLAVVRALLPAAPGAAYLDVSVPARPVSGGNSQVEG